MCTYVVIVMDTFGKIIIAYHVIVLDPTNGRPSGADHISEYMPAQLTGRYGGVCSK